MSKVEFHGKAYEVIRASDVEKDGMWLELWDHSQRREKLVLACFYSDVDGHMTFSAYREDMPLDVVEWFIAQSRQLFPPAEAENAPAHSGEAE